MEERRVKGMNNLSIKITATPTTPTTLELLGNKSQKWQEETFHTACEELCTQFWRRLKEQAHQPTLPVTRPVTRESMGSCCLPGHGAKGHSHPKSSSRPSGALHKSLSGQYPAHPLWCGDWTVREDSGVSLGLGVRGLGKQ
ncbi:Hypothetical predicted protein [Pelobates cultripes]|uniref:Uncharacterized protein n=1 Tax=Pelobates cultripes TaxID=61616 RepID=A0AAD1S7P5_PELCU|nr:Hypothetical predicted protein [Pelobates cultripes]